MTDIEIIKQLTKIVPGWKNVALTKAGYSEQRVKTLAKLVTYIKSIK